MPALKFRKDINGLRAIAVLGVILYHFQGMGFAGGFAGVDIFLVISGYLMTAIILTGLAGQKFTLSSFYVSRAKRILPALLFLIFVLLVFGYFYLIPADYKTLGLHASSAVTFLSNFVFKGESGYFDTPMRDKWLLHTWSLSLEWQFYLLYPLFLMGIYKWREKLPLSLSLLAAVSLLLSIYFTPIKDSFSFYLLPTRIWEFIAGGLVYVFLQKRAIPSRYTALLQYMGLGLITLSFVVFTGDMLWPSYLAVIPVLGTALVMLAAQQNSPLTGNIVAQKLGTWSYSIYLWHWPIVVGIGYWGLSGQGITLLGIAASIVLGYLSYRFIETPARKKISIRFLLVSVVAITIVGMAIYVLKGLSLRVAPAINAIEQAHNDRYQLPTNCGFEAGSEKFTRCYLGGKDKLKFILWGDSHAGAAASAVHEALGNGIIYSIGRPVIFGVKQESDRSSYNYIDYNQIAFTDIKTLPRDLPLLIVNRFSYYLLGHNDGLKRPVGLTYQNLTPNEQRMPAAELFSTRLTHDLCAIAKTRKVYVLKPIPEMGIDIPMLMARRMMLEQPLPNAVVTLDDYKARNVVTLGALDKAAKQCGVKLLDPVPALCPTGSCTGFINGAPIYFDDDHLNEKGNKYLVPLLKSIR